jgi:predicted O-methyltransferase YrrM
MKELNISRLKDFSKLIRSKGYKVGAEIGVARGFYSKWICYYNPDLKLYCIDPWLAYCDDYSATTQETQEANFIKAKERLAEFNCQFIRENSRDASELFKDGSLDFVFIDADHRFEHVVEDINLWEKKIRPGGIVSGHDYNIPQVQYAVDGWVKSKNIKEIFVMTVDKGKSWFWMKEE